MSCPRRLNAQLHLVVAFILMLLVADIRPDHPFIKPDRRNKIPSSPENLASEILCSTPKAPRYRNCALPLDVSHHIRYRIFRGNADAHVHVIRHDVPFYNLRFLVRRKFVEYLAQMLAQNPKYPSFALLRNEYHVILTIPSCEPNSDTLSS